MTLRKLGHGYVNPEEISHIVCEVREIHGKNIVKYGIWMKNGAVFSVSKEEMETYRKTYLMYLEPNHVEVEDVF